MLARREQAHADGPQGLVDLENVETRMLHLFDEPWSRPPRNCLMPIYSFRPATEKGCWALLRHRPICWFKPLLGGLRPHLPSWSIRLGLVHKHEDGNVPTKRISTGYFSRSSSKSSRSRPMILAVSRVGRMSLTSCRANVRIRITLEIDLQSLAWPVETGIPASM